jgi:hypothetical protein
MNAEQTDCVTQWVRFDKWAKALGITRSTAWRWRKTGVVRAEALRLFYGKLYIHASEIARFDEMINSGDQRGQYHGVCEVRNAA